jgi:hypothetical protein
LAIQAMKFGRTPCWFAPSSTIYLGDHARKLRTCACRGFRRRPGPRRRARGHRSRPVMTGDSAAPATAPQIPKKLIRPGGDAPSLHTMCIDKPMRRHRLMRDIARVNRVFKERPPEQRRPRSKALPARPIFPWRMSAAPRLPLPPSERQFTTENRSYEGQTWGRGPPPLRALRLPLAKISLQYPALQSCRP